MDVPFYPDFSLVSTEAYCIGYLDDKGYMTNIHSCGAACRKIFQMFSYGIGGSSECNAEKCKCFCATETDGFECKGQVDDSSLDLYTFKGKFPLILQTS